MALFLSRAITMKIKFPFPGKKSDMNKERAENTAEENQEPAAESQVQEENQPAEIEMTPLEKAETELAELKDQHRRLYAEFDNFRKRSMKERLELIKTAGSDTIISLLPVLDDFDRAIKALETVPEGPLKDGVNLIHQKLISILQHKGLTAMQSIGEDFNTDLHEAVTNIPAGEEKVGKVVDELEKGYMLNDKVIRYAKVVVGS